jgi:hypothetical protein
MACPFLKKAETDLCIAYSDRPLVVNDGCKLSFCESSNYVNCPTLKERK